MGMSENEKIITQSSAGVRQTVRTFKDNKIHVPTYGDIYRKQASGSFDPQGRIAVIPDTGNTAHLPKAGRNIQRKALCIGHDNSSKHHKALSLTKQHRQCLGFKGTELPLITPAAHNHRGHCRPWLP